MPFSEKSAAQAPASVNDPEIAAETLLGTTVGISLTPAVVGQPSQEEPARLVCQTRDAASKGLQKKLAEQLIDSLGKAGAIETCQGTS